MAWKHASSPHPRKFCIIASVCKVMATIFWDARELYWLIILSTAAPSQEPSMLIWLENVGWHWRRRDKESCVVECCFTKTTHLLTRQKLSAIGNAGFELLRHSSYFLDLAPSDLYLFKELKEFVKGYRFADDKDAICMALMFCLQYYFAFIIHQIGLQIICYINCWLEIYFDTVLV